MLGAVIVAALLQAQPVPEDAPPLSAVIDASIQAIPGYNARNESMPVQDDVFLRRLMKDLVGEAPSDAEIQAFGSDPDPRKRLKKIDRLLEDDRFGAHWAGRFVRVFFGAPEKVHFGGLGELGPGVEAGLLPAFTAWLATKIQKDVPWKEIVTDLLDARGTTEGDPALAYKLSFYRSERMPEEFAEGMPRHLLGISLGCARCHDHPYDSWRVEDFYGMAAFIVRQRAERVGGIPQIRYRDEGELTLSPGEGFQVVQGKGVAKEIPPVFLFGGKAEKNDDRMKMLAFFMTRRSTPELPRALANRVWSWLFGRGLVQPVHECNMKRRTALSPALLDALVRDLVDNGSSIKRLVRAISNSAAYQMPTPEEAPDAESVRHLALRKAPSRVYPKLGSPPPALPFTVDLPPSWTRVREKLGTKALFLVPEKADGTRVLELTLCEGKASRIAVDSLSRQIQPLSSATEKLAGKLPVTLTEYSGHFPCQNGAEGPIDYRFWSAAVESGEKTYHFQLGGPAAALDGLREEFVAMIKGARK